MRSSPSLRAFATLALLTATALPLSGCAAEEETAAESHDELRDGLLTYERPAIGLMLANDFTGCTATLVAEDVILTAAHCFGFGSKAPTGEKLGAFHIQTSDADHHAYEYDGFISFGRGAGGDDVALAHLMVKVPEAVAVPMKISTSTPTDASNEVVTMYGVGCQHRPGLFGSSDEPEPNLGKKQKRTFEMGPVRYGCPGDSGGPTVRNDGTVFRVTSKMYFIEIFGWGRGDSFGDAVKWREEVDAQILAWR